VFLIATVIVGGIVALIGWVLHLAGVPTIALAVPGVLLGLAWYALTVGYGMMIAVGPVLTYMDAYALFFLGGRYPILGDMLDASTPPAAAPAMYSYPGYAPPVPPIA
jgi:hypothetical protein